MEDEIIEVMCKGHGCEKREQVDRWGDIKYHVWQRSDVYGLATGCYCEDCYENNYPYRKDAYFDPEYCGERMEDDY